MESRYFTRELQFPLIIRLRLQVVAFSVLPRRGTNSRTLSRKRTRRRNSSRGTACSIVEISANENYLEAWYDFDQVMNSLSFVSFAAIQVFAFSLPVWKSTR